MRDYDAPSVTEIGRVEELTQNVTVAGDETEGGGS
jgi:hypothetical protein